MVHRVAASGSNAEKLLQVVESISGVINPSIAFSAYLAIAKPVLEGVQSLLGLQQTVPVLGYRIAINPAIGQVLEPTYYILIDADAQQIERDKFWVRNDRLYYGQTPDTTNLYDKHDFILEVRLAPDLVQVLENHQACAANTN